MTAESREERPGYYVSPFEKYPGFIQFPYPLMLAQMLHWWKKGIEGIKNLSALDAAFHQSKWEAARDLLVDYDGWHVEGIPVGDVKNDLVPMEVVTFAVMSGDAYLLSHLTPKVRRVLPSTI